MAGNVGGFRWAVLAGLVGCFVASGGAADRVADPVPTVTERSWGQEARVIVDLLQNYHYAQVRFADLDGAEAISRLLRVFDPGGMFLTNRERDFLQRRFRRTLKSVYLIKGDVRPAYEVFDFVRERALRRFDWIDARLERGMELRGDTTWDPGDWEGGNREADLDARWVLRLQDDVIREALAGHSPAEAHRRVREEYRRWQRHLESLDAAAVRAVFLNELLGLFDAHSGYSSADEAAEFELSQMGQLAGLGLDVWMDEGRCRVAAILPGGPAEAAEVLQVGDELTAMAEGDGEWVPLAGQRIAEVALRMRGEPGSRVRLRVRRGEAGDLEAGLQRETITLVEHKAGAVLFTPAPGRGRPRVGWVTIPSFYGPESGGEAGSMTEDVRILLERLKAGEADVIALDLRDNPGGQTREAVALAGLFVGPRPVMVTQAAEGIATESAVEPQPVWGGPLVVVTNRASASASELLAGALRYHRRALVVGETTTFGKGTAQAFMDLNDEVFRQDDSGVKWGTLRLTMQRFYLPDGTSPQQVGIPSDVVLAELTGAEVETERDREHVLPNDRLSDLAEEERWEGDWSVTPELIATLRTGVEKRRGELPEFGWQAEDRAEAAAEPERKLPLDIIARENRRGESEQAAWERRLARLRLAHDETWTQQRLFIPEVGEMRAAHASWLAARAQDGEALWQHGRYWRKRPDGGWMDVNLAEVDFAAFAPVAEELATAFASAAGRTVSTSEIDRALRQWSRLPWPSRTEVLRCFGEVDAATEAGLMALLARMIDLDPSLGAPELRFDLGRRETLRVIIDWWTGSIDQKTVPVASPEEDNL